MRTAIYYKKERTIYLFVSKNTAEYKNCYSLTQAKQLVKNSGIEQTLKIC